MMSLSGQIGSSRTSRRGTYFFLSYAHSAPHPGGMDADPWVAVLFKHLCAEVEGLAQPHHDLDIGFFDGLLHHESDWRASLSAALGAAEVFVPLYSPSYLSQPWPMNELRSFKNRLEALHLGQPTQAQMQRHIVPVLWMPVPPWDQLPEVVESLELGDGVPEYAENGLRALCMLSMYQHHYRDMVRTLARRIVEVAEGSPLGASAAPALEDTSEAPSVETAFLIAIIAPTAKGRMAGMSEQRYGPVSRLWRPFPDVQDVPIAQYAANMAERLGLFTRVVDFTGDAGVFDTCPGVLLVDPWILSTAGGESLLLSAQECLHDWVAPLVVVDDRDLGDAQQATRVSVAAIDLLVRPGGPRVWVASRAEEAWSMIPALITKARRRYLRSPLIHPLAGRHPPQPRLSSRWLGRTRTGDADDRAS